jgi:hypothetical protein
MEVLKIEEMPFPIRLFAAFVLPSDGQTVLRMTVDLRRGISVHEQVPNTNIKFICPEFKEKMFLDKKPTLHEFSPNTNTKLF